jgi:hypothetical protein
MKSKICCNCLHSGTPFKLGGLTHQHCEHLKYKEIFIKGELNPWDTVMKFSDKCDDFNFKQSKNK